MDNGSRGEDGEAGRNEPGASPDRDDQEQQEEDEDEQDLEAWLASDTYAARLLGKIRSLLHSEGAQRRALAVYLMIFAVRGDYVRHGYETLEEFAEAHLGMTGCDALELIRVARSLEDIPILDAALTKGEIDWPKLSELSRVAVRATEDAWLGYARGRSLEEIADAVSRSKKGEFPPEHIEAPEPGMTTLVLEFETLWEKLFFQAYVEKIRSELRAGATDGEVLEHIAKAIIVKLARKDAEKRAQREGSEANGPPTHVGPPLPPGGGDPRSGTARASP